MGVRLMYVICEQHLEQAIDEFIDEYECSPDVYVLTEVHFKAWTQPAMCDKCQTEPKYLVI